jgi:hypothetical protein
MSRFIRARVVLPVAFGAAVAATYLSTMSLASAAQPSDSTGQCHHVEWPATEESTYQCTDSTSRFTADSVSVTYEDGPIRSPAPEAQFAPALYTPGEPRSTSRMASHTVTVPVRSGVDGIFMGTYAVENFLAKYYDSTDRAKAAALRTFISRHWGNDGSKLMLLCQHTLQNNWYCPDSSNTVRIPADRITSMRLIGHGTGEHVVQTLTKRVDAVMFSRDACDKFLVAYYKRRSAEFASRADSLHKALAKWVRK